ncbi:hypothetical protein INT47_011888 [Mucor saturninus]|uniref:Uncharacterized protein n=1 Tax=Mucor saturninus TaxID=64648 RepID=A0A8H7RBQ1_9FUNG|nr:hypothetical protein INT47_011888 [Mucor saturninus]
MAENYLYKQLDFCNINNFNKALDLFAIKPKFGNHVESLTIQSCEIDIVSMFLLPKQFPNTKHLYWWEDVREEEERIDNDISIKNLPHPLIYRRELSKWNQLESVDIRTERLPFLTMLLESSLLDNLTSVTICFNPWHLDNYFDRQTLPKLRPIVKSFISNIKNAPSLKLLAMECAVLDLSDMEELHASVPKLKSLELFCTAISGGATDDWLISTDKKSVLDNNGMAVALNTASTVEKLSIIFYNTMSGIHNIQGDLKDTMRKWLIYIGCKYTDAEIDLKGWANQYLPGINDFHEPIMTTIQRGPNSTTYHAFLYPITKSIMNAIGDRKVELKSLYLYTDVLRSLLTQLDIVKLSGQAKTINRLEINLEGVDVRKGLILESIMSGLSLHFTSLLNLNITCTIFHYALIKLLQGLPSLQILSLDYVYFVNNNVVLVPIVRSKMKKLYLTLSCGGTSTMHEVNRVMDFVLQSCPLLVDFSLSGTMSLSKIKILKLCFFYHEDLKTIKIDIKGVHYYVFSWTEGKQGFQWADYNELADKQDPTNERLHVDIAWRNKDAQLILAKAPVID